MLTVTTSKRIVYNRIPYELLVSENYYYIHVPNHNLHSNTQLNGNM